MPEEINHHIGSLLYELRTTNNFTLLQVEQQTEIEQSIIGQIENGNEPILITHVARLCEYYDVKLSELFAGQ